jgi:hypothetical protein
LKENRRRMPRYLRAVILGHPPMKPRGCTFIDEGMRPELARAEVLGEEATL